jgi:hypothetical protein
MGDKFYKERHVAQGLCRNCTKPIWKGQLCRNHHLAGLEYFKISNKRTRDKILKDKILCPRCHKKLDPELDAGYKHCWSCRHHRG